MTDQTFITAANIQSNNNLKWGLIRSGNILVKGIRAISATATVKTKGIFI